MSSNNHTLFKVGDHVRCDCDQSCDMEGIIEAVDHESEAYLLDTGGVAFFSTAVLVTKLDKVLK